MQPPQNPDDPTGQLWQPSPYPQPEQPSVPPPGPLPPQRQPERPSQPLPPQQQGYQPQMQTPPGYNPAMPGAPWQPQQGYPPQQTYPPQQGYQPQMQTPPGYNPAMPGAPWQPQQQQQGYPQQQIYQQPVPSAVQMTSVNVNVNAQQGPGGCVRAIYFVFIGWWLGFWCLEIGFLLCFFIVTLPLGLVILNRLPQIMTLKPSAKTVQTSVNVASAMGAGGMSNSVNVNVNVVDVQQRPFLLRAVYYIFVGCWVGYLWATIAYFFCLSILGLPLGIVMLNQLPVVLTLRRN